MISKYSVADTLKSPLYGLKFTQKILGQATKTRGAPPFLDPGSATDTLATV